MDPTSLPVYFLESLLLDHHQLVHYLDQSLDRDVIHDLHYCSIVKANSGVDGQGGQFGNNRGWSCCQGRRTGAGVFSDRVPPVFKKVTSISKWVGEPD